MGDVKALVEVLEIVFKKKSDLADLWAACGSFELEKLGELPAGFEDIQNAMIAGLEVQIQYKGKDKPASKRWIKPLHVEMNKGKRYIVSMCLEENIKKSFLISGIIQVFGTRKSG